jgi:hypothetical protein
MLVPLSVTALASGMPLPPWTVSVPAPTIVVPLYALFPPRIRSPEPCFVRLPLPVTSPKIVAVKPCVSIGRVFAEPGNTIPREAFSTILLASKRKAPLAFSVWCRMPLDTAPSAPSLATAKLPRHNSTVALNVLPAFVKRKALEWLPPWSLSRRKIAPAAPPLRTPDRVTVTLSASSGSSDTMPSVVLPAGSTTSLAIVTAEPSAKRKPSGGVSLALVKPPMAWMVTVPLPSAVAWATIKFPPLTVVPPL